MTARHKLISLYSSFGLCVLTSCIPNMDAQNIAMLGTLLLLIGAYVLRSKSAEDSLEAHHATFVIRSIWIWSFVFLLGMMGAGWMVFQNGDNSAFDTLMSSIENGGVPTDADMEQTMQNYFNTNFPLILKTTLLWMAPAQIYAAWRIARGLSRGLKGYRIQNLRSWL